MTDRIAILDCGGQYTKVIDRRVRELSVRSEIFPIDVDLREIEDFNGIILSGGPASVWADRSPQYDRRLFELEVPILGICYGMQLMNQHFGGRVVPGLKREYGERVIDIEPQCPLFSGLEQTQRVLMSHGDSIESLAPDFHRCAVSDKVVAAIYSEKRRLFGVQFHPEVDLTVNGRQMLENFIRGVCGLAGNYSLENRIQASLEKIKEQVGSEKVLVLVSGGVDSAVSAALLQRSLDPEQVYAIHVDHGFMRKEESRIICDNLGRLGFRHLSCVAAEKVFFNSTVQTGEKSFGPMVRVIDPEEKRQIIGDLFIRVVAEEARRLGIDFHKTYLAQGTLRPDLIESGNPDVSDHAHKIKTHHNDVEIIREARARGMVVETNWDWHKDEVREVARRLGIDERVAARQPFPGPGLAIRFICHDGQEPLSREQREQAARSMRDGEYSGQIVAVRTVGVQGDSRSYRFLGILYGRALEADWSRLSEIGARVPGELETINRVAYLLNREQAGDSIILHPAVINREDMDLLRELDSLVRAFLDKPPISQVFAVLIPIGETRKRSVAIRTFITNDYMTGRAAIIGEDIAEETVRQLTREIEQTFPQLEYILYDVTGKPPATVEWE